MMRLFSSRTPVIPMTRWLEAQLGATIPLEIVVRFQPESQTKMVDRMRLVADIHEQIRHLPGATGCLSAATFAPPVVTSSENLGLFRKALIDEKLKRSFDLLRDAGWIARDSKQEMWRISLRVRAIDDLDYSTFSTKIRSAIEPVVDDHLGADWTGVDFIVTGTAPIVFKARQSLLEGMLFGLGTDVVLIVVGVIAITRSLLTGLMMLLLSLFPTTLVFGLMGWLGVVVDIGSAMTPCIIWSVVASMPCVMAA
jgi:predicted RND superfamily exporter protein